ncbi:MAG: aminopeptidase P N-terminal domain-containing protein, partial [Flavobacteriales bacterium]
MKYLPIDKALYIENRKRFSTHLQPGSLAVFNSNDILPTNADGTMAFRQNNDIFYLSGIDQEESRLVLFPECHDPRHREILFLKETNDEIAVWEGAKHNKQTAFEASGVKTVYWLNQFDRVFKALMSEAEHVYLNTNEHLRASTEVQTRDARFVLWCKEHYPAHQYRRSAPIMHVLRSIKHSLELEKMQNAINITEKGFKRVLSFIKPGVMEFEVEAEYIHEFTRNRSRGFAYTPIIASGYNACVLHYIDNDKPCKEGDVLLMDVGAEYGNYAADMTRCVPVSGKFTPRQKDVYNAVLRVMLKAT